MARLAMALGLMAATMALVGVVGIESAGARPSPGNKLLNYLWDYRNGQLRPYVTSVSLSGVSGPGGVIVNVHESLHARPPFANAAHLICRIADAGAKKLHIAKISAVQVWSVEGHPVARC
jgi:hypothetical protein